MAHKFSEPSMQFNGEKVTPDEIDQDQQYIVMKISVGTADLGTASVTGDGSLPIIITNPILDYPRNIQLSILGVAGGMGGTAVVNGQDQFGNVISESLGFATAAGGGTVAGTKVFARVTGAVAGTAGTVTIAGLGGTAVGSAYLGVGAGSPMIFGLPARIGGSADLKRANWIDNAVVKPLNINSTGTSATGGTQFSSVSLQIAGGANVQDDYVFTYRSSFNATNDGNLFKS